MEIKREIVMPMSEACAAMHFGLWSIEPGWFRQAVAALNAGQWAVITPSDAEEDEVKRELEIVGNGIALITLNGQLTKGFSKFGGTSMIRARQKIRLAASSKSVKAIMLIVDSPGGTVAGTDELAEDVRKAAAEKLVVAHVDDLAASAAFWVISQATRITASKTSEIGSIGTMAVVEDSSKRAEQEGITVHVISTGTFKGAGVPGTEITKQFLDTVQQRVDDTNAHFLSAIASGRGMTAADVDNVADGRVFIAAKAKKLGLIDTVASFDESFAALNDEVASSSRTRRLSVKHKRLEREAASP